MAKRIRITRAKIFGHNGVPLPVGSEHVIEGDIPAGWKDSVLVLSDDAGKTPVVTILREDDDETDADPDDEDTSEDPAETLGEGAEDPDAEGDDDDEDEAPQKRPSRRRR